MQRFSMRRGILQAATLLLFAAAVWVGSGAAAQPPATKKGPPPPEEVKLKTKDGVELHATYYGSKLGKEAVPVICLHGFRGSGKDFDAFARALQSADFAVISPDLRGHGRSTKIRRPNGREETLDAARLTRPDFELMVREDLEAVKSFLIDRNNAAELNIDKLCVMGADLGAILGMNWAALDWSWPQYPTLRQGRDVKGLVLLSPQWSFKGITINTALGAQSEAPKLSYLIVAGSQDPTALRDAQNLHKRLEKFHPTPPPEQIREKKTLFLIEPDTSLQGTKLLGEASLNVGPTIAQFMQLRMARQSYPWAERKRPF